MDALTSLKGKQVYWLKQMMERRLITDQACEVIKEYLPFGCENSSSFFSTSGSEDTATELQSNSGRTGIHFIYSLLCWFVMPSF